MLKYYFIPESYETLLAQYANDWNSNENKFTIIIGIYKPANILNEQDSLVINKNILNKFETIKKGYKDKENNYYGLIGFCLKADLETVANDIYVIISNLHDILAFNTSDEFFQHVKTL